MKKYAIGMTACNRPNYLGHVLVSLANNQKLENFDLHFAVEPIDAEVIKLCKETKICNAQTHINNKVLGVRDNPYQMLNRLFDMGYEAVLYLEDDVELAEDALEMALWFFENVDSDSYLCLNLYNHDSSLESANNALIPGDKFSALGIGITADEWKNYFKPSWYADKRGWDFSFSNMIANNIKVLQPEISRSKHIGRFGGVHYRAKAHDHLYVNNPMWEGKAPESYWIRHPKNED